MPHGNNGRGRAEPPPIHLVIEPAYERQPSETIQAWSAFKLYRDLGPNRSIVEAYRESRGGAGSARERDAAGHFTRHIRQPSGQWTTWSTIWQWSMRAQAWDFHLDAVSREAQENAAREVALQLASERRRQRDRELEMGNKLLERAEQMLNLPVVDVEIEREPGPNGERIIQHVHAAKWRLADAAAIARMGVELRRLGLDMETSRTAVRVDIEEEVRRMARENGWDEDATVREAIRFAEERGDRTG